MSRQLPSVTHLQFLVLEALDGVEQAGRDLRALLVRHQVRTSGPAFYQMMARLEAASLVEGANLLLVGDRAAPHQLLALSASLARLWPPGPETIASATAPIVEALLSGSRRLHHAATVIDGELGARGKAVLLPLEIGVGGIVRHVMPSLSAQERTELMNSLGRS